MGRILLKLNRLPVFVAGVMLFAACGGGSLPSAQAQEDDDKKVLQKTTDKESGFEKQLTEVDLIYQTASQYMSAGQWDKAVAELQKVVAAKPDRVEAWQDMAKCYKMLEQHAESAEAYGKAVELQPGNLDLLSNLGFAQLNAQLLEDAVVTYNRMLDIDSLNYDASVHLGFVYQKDGDLVKAARYYEKALKGNANDVQTMGSLAKIYLDLTQNDKAVAMYERAIDAAADEQKAQLRSKLGAALISSKNYEKSAEVFNALVETNPENAAHRFNLGISLMQLKRHKEAAPHMEKVIELRPDYVQAYQQLAACYNETGKYSKAVSIIKQGLPMTDQKAGLYCTWGRSLEKMQLFDEAIDIFQKAINDPQWGSYAKKQIKRQLDLKKRAEMIREQQGM